MPSASHIIQHHHPVGSSSVGAVRSPYRIRLGLPRFRSPRRAASRSRYRFLLGLLPWDAAMLFRPVQIHRRASSSRV